VACVADGVEEWEALNKPTDREGFDLPSRFDLSSVSGVTQLTRRVRQQSEQAAYAGPTRTPGATAQSASSTPARPRTAPAPPHFTHRSLVRPYARTGGRTKPARELALEALVVTTERGRRYEGVESPEQRFICDLCVDVHSVAEIAAFARLPLGVVKVLVDDLSQVGAVEIRRPGFVLDDKGSQEFMQRILNGLRSL
jgi:hypothetical protein